jgi:predicted GNAT family acetyltransferase
VQRTAFGDGDAVTDAEIERWGERNADWIRLAGLRDGRIVGVASAAPPVEGAAELVGVATLSDHRGQGIASALTAEVVARAFAAGAEVAWLTAADDAAARLYERVGFAPVGRQVSYNAG